jgi:hypothetical protein
MMVLRPLTAEVERHPELPSGGEERFAGFGVMGLPFDSGHVLALRRFPASSIGPAYTAVWHRDPAGRWAFWQDQPDDQVRPQRPWLKSSFTLPDDAGVAHLAEQLFCNQVVCR